MSQDNDEIVCGMNPVLEALKGSRKAFELFVAVGASDRRLDRVLALAKERQVPVRQRDRRDLARLSGSEHHQGVALRLEGFSYADLDALIARSKEPGETGLLLLCDSVQDPHNLGALIRSAACAGAHGVIIQKDRAVGVTGTVEKVSSGAIETIPVAQVTNLAMAIDTLKEAGFWVFGAEGTAGRSLYDLDLTVPAVMVIGGEGEGIRPLVRKKCDQLAAIPLTGGVSSLNASVAGGIFLFEAVRQRIKKLKC